MRFGLGYFLVGLLLFCQGVVANESFIYWHTYHRPPSSIQTGELAGQGFIDKVNKAIAEAMPDYQHLFPVASPERTIDGMRAGKQICHSAWIKTEVRQEFAIFSNPSVMAPSIRLVGARILNTPAQQSIKLNFEQLSTHSTFVFNRGRAYGKVVDEFLRKVPRNQKMVFSTDKSDELFQLLVKEKIDYSFSYPIEVNFYNLQNPEANLKTWFIEGVPNFLFGHVACAKTDWGQAVINSINNVLKELVYSPQYMQEMSFWWPEETDTDEFQAFYDQQFLASHNEASATN